MRTIGLLAMLALGAGCANTMPDGADGTGGEMRRPDGGIREVFGTGGAATCDQACQVDALWQRYVAAVTDVSTAQAAYNIAFDMALTAASRQCGCGNSQCPQSCPNDQTTTATAIAWDAPATVTAQASLDSAIRNRDSLYSAYLQAAIAAGQTPMAKIQ